jgi:hypothetical protein
VKMIGLRLLFYLISGVVLLHLKRSLLSVGLNSIDGVVFAPVGLGL